jgi:hypothetical protein
MQTFRAAVMQFKGKKIAEMEGGEYEINSGDEPHFGPDGLLGFGEGPISTKMVCNVVIPVAGMTSTLEDALLRKQVVTMGWIGNGKLHQVDMKPINAKYTTDTKTGSLKGTFEFQGGKPDVTG